MGELEELLTADDLSEWAAHFALKAERRKKAMEEAKAEAKRSRR